MVDIGAPLVLIFVIGAKVGVDAGRVLELDGVERLAWREVVVVIGAPFVPGFDIGAKVLEVVAAEAFFPEREDPRAASCLPALLTVLLTVFAALEIAFFTLIAIGGG